MKTLLSLITIVYIKKVCITFGDHTSVDNTFVHNSFADNIVVDNTFVDNTFVSDQQVNILLSDDSITLMIAKIVDQIYVTVVLNLLMISSHHIIPAHVVVVMQKIV